VRQLQPELLRLQASSDLSLLALYFLVALVQKGLSPLLGTIDFPPYLMSIATVWQRVPCETEVDPSIIV